MTQDVQEKFLKEVTKDLGVHGRSFMEQWNIWQSQEGTPSSVVVMTR